MKYEVGKIYKNVQLPGEFFKQHEERYRGAFVYTMSDPNHFRLIWFRQEKEWFVFCPMDENNEKYIFHRSSPPPHIFKQYVQKLEETIDSLKYSRDKINSL